MKITVITDKAGKIVGTARQGIETSSGVGYGGPVAGPRQKVHVIDLPVQLEGVEATAELHSKLEKLIPRLRKTGKVTPSKKAK